MTDDQIAACKAFFNQQSRLLAQVAARSSGPSDASAIIGDTQKQTMVAYRDAIAAGVLPTELDAIARQAERMVID